MRIFVTATFLFRDVLVFLLVLRALLSWFCNESNFIYRFLLDVTDPIINPVKKLINRTPLGNGSIMLDFSCIISIMLINFIAQLIARVAQLF